MPIEIFFHDQKFSSPFWHRSRRTPLRVFASKIHTLYCCHCSDSLKISPVSSKIIETWKKGCRPFAFVTIECSSQWIGVPDVRFEHIDVPVTNIEPGGTESDKVSHHFLERFKDPPIDATCFEFTFQDGEYLVDQWEGAQIKSNLYVAVPNDFLSVGIKEGFVSLLDYAEESLKVTSVTLCIPKSINEREMVLKAFRAMGLELLNPGHVTNLRDKDDLIFMVYKID